MSTTEPAVREMVFGGAQAYGTSSSLSLVTSILIPELMDYDAQARLNVEFNYITSTDTPLTEGELLYQYVTYTH